MQETTKQADAQPRFVKVMADYSSTGLWDSQGCSVEETFAPMSAALLERLRAWCRWYESNEDYNPEPVEQFDYAAFSAEGLNIARALKAELPDWTVVYFDEAKMVQSQRGGPKERSFFEYVVTVA